MTSYEKDGKRNFVLVSSVRLTGVLLILSIVFEVELYLVGFRLLIIPEGYALDAKECPECVTYAIHVLRDV